MNNNNNNRRKFMQIENKGNLQNKKRWCELPNKFKKIFPAKKLPTKRKSNVCICVAYAFDQINI